MKLEINLDEKVEGQTLDEIVKEKLKKAKLPECLGDMCPPIISKKVSVSADNIIKHRKAIPQENISGALEGDQLLSDMVVDVNGQEYLKQYKEGLATKYVERLVSCTQCMYIDLCDKLTTHYLNTLRWQKD